MLFDFYIEIASRDVLAPFAIITVVGISADCDGASAIEFYGYGIVGLDEGCDRASWDWWSY